METLPHLQWIACTDAKLSNSWKEKRHQFPFNMRNIEK